MKMWLKQSALVLFTAVMVISAEFSVVLDQTRRQEDIAVGSSLVLRCRLRIEQYQRFRVSWYFIPSGPSLSGPQNLSEKVILQNNTAVEKSDEKQDFEETYSLLNVSFDKSGLYFCKVTVDIPQYKCYNSSGTQVIITSSSTTVNNLMEIATYPSLVTSKPAAPSVHSPVIKWWMWIVLGVSAVILLVVLVLCILLGRRCHKSRDPDPIYMNSRPMVSRQPSPLPSVSKDNLKIPAPSSQCLRTPSPGRRYEEGNRRQRR